MKHTNLLEYQFAVKVAHGLPFRDAYAEVFGVVPKTPKEIHALDARASRLAKRADIADLIADEQKLKGQRISADERKMAEEIRRNLGTAVMAAQKSGGTLKGNVVKATELYLKSTGQFAPEEHILKNGGTINGAFVPRGIEGMSEDDLKGIIEADGRIIPPSDAPQAAQGADVLPEIGTR